MTSSLIPKPGDVVLVNFDFLDHTGSKLRPAVVLSQRTYNEQWLRFIFTPVTSSAGSVHGAIQIQDLPEAGLDYRSYCQGIIATADNREIKRIIGQLSARDMHNLRTLMRDILSI
jgi:mRNA interferase MazF